VELSLLLNIIEQADKSESETDKDLQSTEEVPANENTEKNQHEIDETTTKDYLFLILIFLQAYFHFYLRLFELIAFLMIDY
jgi:hypothetical protein